MSLSPISSPARGGHRRYRAAHGRRVARACSRGRRVLLGALLLWAAAQTPALAQRPCADFSWNVRHERELFASAPRSLHAGTGAASAPSIQADRLYALQLAPQQQVHFITGPGKQVLSGGDYAGVVRLRVPQAGSYRVSVDAPFWIDVVAAGKLLPTQDFQGQRGCALPRKIVEFVLPAHQDLWLQFSDEPRMQLQVTVTRSPPPRE